MLFRSQDRFRGNSRGKVLGYDSLDDLTTPFRFDLPWLP
jgi:hypothetical protein